MSNEENRIVVPSLEEVLQIGPFKVRPIRAKREVGGERRMVIVAFEACDPPFPPFVFQQDSKGGDSDEGDGFREDSRIAFISYHGGVIVARPRDPMQWVPEIEAPKAVEYIRFSPPRVAKKGDKLVWSARVDPLDPFDLLTSDEWREADEHIRLVLWRREEGGREGTRIVGKEHKTGMVVFPDNRKVRKDFKFELGVWQHWNLIVPDRGGALLAQPLPGATAGNRVNAGSSRGMRLVRKPSREELVAAGYYSDEELRHIKSGNRWVDVYKVLGLEPGCDLKTARAAYKAKVTRTSADRLVGKYQHAIEAQVKGLEGVVNDSGNDALKAAWEKAQADKPLAPETELGRVVEALDEDVLNAVLKGRINKHIHRVETARQEYQKASGFGLQEAGKYQALIKAALDRVKEIIKGRPKGSIMIEALAEEVKHRPLDIQWFMWTFKGKMVSSDGTAIVKEEADRIREYYVNKRMPVKLADMYFSDLGGYCAEVFGHLEGEGRKGKPTTAWAVPVIANHGWSNYIVKDGQGNLTAPDFVLRALFWAFENNRKLKGDGPEFKLWQIAARVNYETGTDITVSQAEALLAYRGVDLPTEDVVATYAFDRERAVSVYGTLLEFGKELVAEEKAEGKTPIFPVRILPGNETVANLAARLTAYTGKDVLSEHIGAFHGNSGIKQEEFLTPAQVQVVLVEVMRASMKPRPDRRITVEELALAEGVTTEQIRMVASEIQPTAPVANEKLKTGVELTEVGTVRIKVGALMRQAERKRAQSSMVRVVSDDGMIAGSYLRQIVEVLRERHSDTMPEMVVIEEFVPIEIEGDDAAVEIHADEEDGIEPGPLPVQVLAEASKPVVTPPPLPADALKQ